MSRKRYTEEQIIGFLKQAEAGVPLSELVRTGNTEVRSVMSAKSAFWECPEEC